MSTTEQTISTTSGEPASSPGIPAGEVSSPSASPAPQPITADVKDRREVIKQAMTGKVPPARLRDESGRFTGTANAGDVLTVKGGEVVSVTPKPQRPPMPNTWNKELAPHWEQAPIEILNRAIAREEEMKRGLEPFKTAKQQYDELMGVIQPYEPMLKASNSTPKQAIESLFRTAAVLRTGSPQEKAAAISSVLREYGIPLEHLTTPSAIPQNSAPPTAMPDPIIHRLAQQVDQLTAAQTAEAERRVNAVINEFANSPDHPHYMAVAETMANLLSSPAIFGSDFNDLSEMAKMQKAYDAAVRLTPEIYALVQAQAAVPKPNAPQAEASTPQRKPGLQVKGAPAQGAPPKPDPKDRRSVIRAAMHRTV